MSSKLFAKANLLKQPVPSAVSDQPEANRPRTAPGQMMDFLASQSAVMAESEKLREQARSFEGALPSRPIDPTLIRLSTWANRDDRSFKTAAYFALKEEIAAAGGNVQPIKVRPIVDASTDPDTPQFEIVFGQRRHRACLELGLPVLAMIEAVSDEVLFVQMDRENRNRANLSPWEQGKHYCRALDDGLFPSNAKLAAAVGAHLTNVGKAIALARLPDEVVNAFSSPLDLQYGWASAINAALRKDPELVLKRARSLSTLAVKKKPALVLKELLEGETSTMLPPKQFLEKGGTKVATICTNAKGMVEVSIAQSLPPEKMERLTRWLSEFLKADK